MIFSSENETELKNLTRSEDSTSLQDKKSFYEFLESDDGSDLDLSQDSSYLSIMSLLGRKKKNQLENNGNTEKILGMLEFKNKNKIIFKKILNNKQNYRNKYYINYFKNCFVKWFMKKINNYIKVYEKPRKLDKPTTRLFISKKNLKKNQQFLEMRMEDILCLQGSNKLKKNAAIIKKVFENPEKSKKAVVTLENSLEDEIKLFYDSEFFGELEKSSKIQLLEVQFKSSTKMSLIKKYGFIEFLKKNGDF